MAGVGGRGGVKGGWWLERERPGGEAGPLGGYVVVRCRGGNSRGDYPPVALIGKAVPLAMQLSASLYLERYTRGSLLIWI